MDAATALAVIDVARDDFSAGWNAEDPDNIHPARIPERDPAAADRQAAYHLGATLGQLFNDDADRRTPYSVPGHVPGSASDERVERAERVEGP